MIKNRKIQWAEVVTEHDMAEMQLKPRCFFRQRGNFSNCR